MPQIRPMRDLRDTTAISELCHATDEPVFITKNGYGDLVVMSVEAYDKRLAQLDVLQRIAEAEREIAEGADMLDARAVFGELRKKYGYGTV